MPPRERIDFTERELEALVLVLGESRRTSVVDDRVLLAAIDRAEDKIQRAHRLVTIGQAADPYVFCNRCDNRGKNVPGPGNQNFGCQGCGYMLGEHPNRRNS